LFFEDKLNKINQLLKAIVDLDDAHCGLALQRFTAAVCKVVHLIRSLPRDYEGGRFERFLKQFDESVRGSFDLIAHVSTDKWQRIQLGLPKEFGGLGLTSAWEIADAAYIAGTANSAALVAKILGTDQFIDQFLGEAIERFNERVPQADQLEFSDVKPDLEQKALVSRLANVNLETYRQEGTVQDRARINSLQLGHSLDVLTMVPDARQGHHLSNSETTAYVSLVLGRVPDEGSCMECAQPLDRHGFHALSCSTGRRLKKRHDGAVNVLATHAQRARYKVREDVAIMRDGPNRPRPADLLLRRFQDGKDAALDVTFVAPLQKKHLKKAANNVGVAVKAAEAVKRRKYAEQCRQHNVIFIPIAAETYGGWGPSAIKAFETIIAVEAATLERPVGPLRKQFYNDLAIVIARHAAAAILERAPEIDVDNPVV
jgi:hypothetical protein